MEESTKILFSNFRYKFHYTKTFHSDYIIFHDIFGYIQSIFRSQLYPELIYFAHGFVKKMSSSK